ncbi:ATP-dependent Clp protease proteolytic subunit, partial [Escherichia coli]|nr:ATP-dependent Clp protease proteolytic subunit [Escherichia coli]
GFTGGDAEDMRTYADLLDKVEAVLLPAYAQKNGKNTDENSAMLAEETWMSGGECLAQGLSLLHISQPPRPRLEPYAGFCFEKK